MKVGSPRFEVDPETSAANACAIPGLDNALAVRALHAKERELSELVWGGPGLGRRRGSEP
jgi:hypothetical protein